MKSSNAHDEKPDIVFPEGVFTPRSFPRDDQGLCDLYQQMSAWMEQNGTQDEDDHEDDYEDDYEDDHEDDHEDDYDEDHDEDGHGGTTIAWTCAVGDKEVSMTLTPLGFGSDTGEIGLNADFSIQNITTGRIYMLTLKTYDGQKWFVGFDTDNNDEIHSTPEYTVDADPRSGIGKQVLAEFGRVFLGSDRSQSPTTRPTGKCAQRVARVLEGKKSGT